MILSKYSTHRVSQQTTLQFSKKFPLPQNGGHFKVLPNLVSVHFKESKSKLGMADYWVSSLLRIAFGSHALKASE